MILKHLTQFAQWWNPASWGRGGGGGDQSSEITISAGDLGLGGTPTQIGGGEVQMIFNLVYAAAAFAAIIVIIIGGIRYASSNGDSSGIQSAKNTIMYAVIGLIVVIIAAAITNFVLAIVVGQPEGGTPTP